MYRSKTEQNQTKTEAAINNDMFPFKIGCCYANPRQINLRLRGEALCYVHFNELFCF